MFCLHIFLPAPAPVLTKSTGYDRLRLRNTVHAPEFLTLSILLLRILFSIYLFIALEYQERM